MLTQESKVRKVGCSLGMIIPKKLVGMLELIENEELHLDLLIEDGNEVGFTVRKVVK